MPRPPKPKTDRLTVLSAFSGAGGLDLGLEAAGFITVAAIERDRHARATLEANKPGWHLLPEPDIEQAARRLKPRDLGLARRELAMLAGGPPCKPYSSAAQWSALGRRGIADPRSQCIHSFFALAEAFLPRVILIENVAGFLAGPRCAIDVVTACLESINRRCKTRYRADWLVVDAADFGVPQHRRRALLVARRDGKAFSWPVATHSDRPVRAWDALRTLPKQVRVDTPTGQWARLLPSIPEGQNYLWHTERGGGRPLFGYRTKYWSFLLKLAKAEPAWTLAASPGPATGPFHWDNRPLTIQEMLRLQTFPPKWHLDGPRREQVRQAGNATPPLLAEVIGRGIAAQVFGRAVAAKPLLAIPRARSVPPPQRCREVHAQYIALEGSHRPHPGEGKGPSARGSLWAEG